MYVKCVSCAAIIALIACLHIGCSTTPHAVTDKADLTRPLMTGPIRVLTNDGTIYAFTEYDVVSNDTIHGIGRIEGLGEDVEVFLNFDSVAYVEARSSNLGRGILVTGFAAAFLWIGNEYMSGLNVVEVHPTHSCPSIYTTDEEATYFESETFAGSVFRGAERVTVDRLTHLRPVNNQYKLELRNERAETDYVDELSLLAVYGPPGAHVVADWWGDLHTLAEPVEPLWCEPLAGGDVLSDVSLEDGVYWEGSPSPPGVGEVKATRDGIILGFRKPAGATSAKIVITGVNSNLLVFAYDQLLSLKGRNALPWLYQLERDSSEAAKLVGFMIREGMLHLHVWTGTQWEERALFPDVGPALAKEQVAVVPIADIRSDTLKVKLESTSGLWRIDRVACDFSDDAALQVREIPPQSAIDKSGRNITHLLTSSDGRYCVTLPGEGATVLFDQPPSLQGREPVVFVKVRGYYHAWLPSDEPEQVGETDRVLLEPGYGPRMYLGKWRKEGSQSPR